MAGYFPAPAKPSVTADPPLAIVGTPDRRLVLAGNGGQAVFESIGTALPPNIPTASTRPLPNGLPQGYPFHLIGTPGVQVVTGFDGANGGEAAFSGDAGTLLDGLPFGDGSGYAWAPLSGSKDTAELDGAGGVIREKSAPLAYYAVTIPGAIGGYFISAYGTIHTALNADTTIGVQLGDGSFGGEYFSLYVQYSSGAAPGNFIGAAYSPSASGQQKTDAGVTAVGVDVPILLQLSVNGTAVEYSITGCVDAANVSGSATLTSALTTGVAAIRLGSGSPADPGGAKFTDVIVGTIGDKAWG